MFGGACKVLYVNGTLINTLHCGVVSTESGLRTPFPKHTYSNTVDSRYLELAYLE